MNANGDITTVVIYCRKSTAQVAGDGLRSVDQQAAEAARGSPLRR
jgi:hypothetical protein